MACTSRRANDSVVIGMIVENTASFPAMYRYEHVITFASIMLIHRTLKGKGLLFKFEFSMAYNLHAIRKIFWGLGSGFYGMKHRKNVIEVKSNV